MTDEPNPLGAYVRARREQVTPEEAGLTPVGTRRVPGLRREEVAMLAGISADYYLRLEQGRDRNPSVQVLESLARVLRLDAAATAYLLRLGTPRPRRRPAPGRPRPVPAGIAQLVTTLALPAVVEDRAFDVLAVNPLATALSPRLVAGANRLWDLFRDPAEQDLYPDWEAATEGAVAVFRESADTGDPRTRDLIGQLLRTDPRFGRLWARHDVRTCEGAPIRFAHPQVGELTLNREKLDIGGTDGQVLLVHHPVPGTDSAGKLALLASIARTPAGAGPRI
ncbi:helix-turn-helix domain-containing protein [Streptomyces griseoviridis]|uniref:Transcriptional regulator with XRE-family HTH domain n=1 Tax=Streptomyces griseoviridis TaxID=45398 RepID=A0ABT9L7A7_STRGD|nr:helix-turn-helix transcriptional regulator [Streptomyces griseoviridis]MDP9679588.1 transcriptional regulator with XRE-family HTH domain [Streptomyces griseoviridis]GGT00061.1 transcriptional regulator [Streptomyces griseoviridis]